VDSPLVIMTEGTEISIFAGQDWDRDKRQAGRSSCFPLS
jgi:hypothetical protein